MRHRRSSDAARSEPPSARADINITPLIDVMLVLLIIFMVVTPLATRSLDAALPRNPKPGDPPPPADRNALVLTVDASGLALNRAPVASLPELEARLRDVFATRADKTLFVHADGAVDYGTVVEAMDSARAAGAERMGLMSAVP